MPDRAATARERYLRYFITFTCHVHAIVEAEAPPERIMNEFKSYASRELNRLTTGGSERKRWARHGSTRWLWKDEDVKRALQYVVDELGEPMALFIADEIRT